MFTHYVRGTHLLLTFYWRNLFLLHSLPKWLRNPDTLQDVVKDRLKELGKSATFSLSLDNTAAKKYNREFDNIKTEMRRLHGGDTELISYKGTLLILFSLRLVCIVSAWQGNLPLTLLLASIQFLVVPYSLFVSLCLAVALIPPIYLSHYIIFSIFQVVTYLITLVCPTTALQLLSGLTQYFYLPIGPAFVLGFFIVDQVLCIYCHTCTPSKQFPLCETLTHAFWGFLNTKTYTLVVLLHMMNCGLTIPVWVWLLDSYFQVTARLARQVAARGAHWLELFYHQHRMAHLPKVYEHGHKLHHYLHGTLSFDAHIYGNGMPEEFFFLVLELCLGVYCGLLPATLNRLVLQYSLDNKFGHTQKPTDSDGGNFHADHHLLHVKNFGIYNCLMDMYFSTSNNNTEYVIKPSLYCPGGEPVIYKVNREISEDRTVFNFTPAGDIQ